MYAKDIPENSLITDFGENYEYAKTIFKNNAEIKKLELIQIASKIIIDGIKIITVFFFLVLIFILSLVLVIVLLANALNSIVLSLLIMIGFLICSILIVYPLLRSVVKSKIETRILQNIKL